MILIKKNTQKISKLRKYELFDIRFLLLQGVILITFLSFDLKAQNASKTGAYTDLCHESKAFGHKKFYRLYLPRGYESSSERYPVIYFFHRWGGRHFKDENAKLEYELIKNLVDKYQLILVMWVWDYIPKNGYPMDQLWIHAT